jgi:hypothetical protein
MAAERETPRPLHCSNSVSFCQLYNAKVMKSKVHVQCQKHFDELTSGLIPFLHA